MKVLLTSGLRDLTQQTAAAPGNGIAGGFLVSSGGVTLFLYGDVMTGRGIDPILPHPSNPGGACDGREAVRRSGGDVAALGRELGYEIPGQQRAFAHRLIELAGIDVVYGHSSHHPKGIEVYKDKLILYGCGDFLNDYEGIAGYEEFRSHLVLAYFLTLDSGSGHLLRLEMAPFELKRFRLQQAAAADAAWLSDMLTREGRPQTVLDARNHLILSWRRKFL